MYIVLKPVNIGGKRRIIGELLEESAVIANRAATLIHSGYLMEMQTIPELMQETVPAEERVTIKVPVYKGKQLLELEIPIELVPQIFAIMQATPEEAVKQIQGITCEDVLILLDAADSRKQIKAAVLEQAKSLHKEEPKEGAE